MKDEEEGETVPLSTDTPSLPDYKAPWVVKQAEPWFAFLHESRTSEVGHTLYRNGVPAAVYADALFCDGADAFQPAKLLGPYDAKKVWKSPASSVCPADGLALWKAGMERARQAER